ncbi:MAG: hypothetical protein PHY29_00880, partial [Syntrophales bacterium]|nr:hypothetical protein [Syntrophales bacterium]
MRYLQNSLAIALVICGLMFAISCGGGSTEPPEGGGGSAAGAITLSADPAVDIPADGASSAAITATIQDGSGEAVVQGTSVTFSTT